MANDNPQRKAVDEVRDIDKDTLMEVRGIIDGIVESGSKDYGSALNDIAATVNEHLFPKQ